jgi:hypothetical protein
MRRSNSKVENGRSEGIFGSISEHDAISAKLRNPSICRFKVERWEGGALHSGHPLKTRRKEIGIRQIPQSVPTRGRLRIYGMLDSLELLLKLSKH